MSKRSYSRMRDDLNWALTSPPLFTYPVCVGESSPWSPVAREPFLSQPVDTALLEEWLSNTNDYRLGSYFEQLVHFYLAHSPLVENVTRSVALRDEGKTLGELDFVYRTKNEPLYTHLEVAVKFYFSMGDPTDSFQWVGLNQTDKLGDKINRTITHQLPIVQRPTCIEILRRLDIQIETSQALIKGRLFYPWKDFVAHNFTYPECITPGHLKGWWLRFDDAEKIDSADIRLFPLTKTHWMAPLNDEEMNTLPTIELGVKMSLIYPLMVARVDCHGYEIDRGVILPNQWPERNC